MKTRLASLLAAAMSFRATCVLVDGGFAEGYIANPSTDTYQATGPVRFAFSEPNSISGSAIDVMANSELPPGQTVKVARVKLLSAPSPGERCRFEVGGAIRKL